MPVTPQRAAKKPAGDRRREIADAALRIIASQGLGRFTALAIAREIGLTDAAIFRHFPTKEAIVDAAIDRVEELLFEGFPADADDPIERLGAFFRGRVAVIREHPGISLLVATDELAKAGSTEGSRRVAEFRQRSTDFVRSSLVEAEQQALLATGLGASEAAVLVLGALLALAHSRTGDGSESTAALAPRVWSALESFLRGREIRSRSAGRRPPRPPGRSLRKGEAT